MFPWIGFVWVHGSVVRTSVFGWQTLPDLWLTPDYFVRKVSTMGHPTMKHAISAFHPSRVGKSLVIHVITWITGVETTKMADHGCMWLLMAVWSQNKVCGHRLSLRPVGCMPTLPVTQNVPLQSQYAACGAICVICLCLFKWWALSLN